MKLKRRLAAAAAGGVLLLGGTLVSMPSATAATGDSGYVIAPACVHLGPSAFYGTAYCTSYDNWIPMGCWTDDGQQNRWFSFYLQPQRWVRADDVWPQPSLPHC